MNGMAKLDERKMRHPFLMRLRVGNNLPCCGGDQKSEP